MMHATLKNMVMGLFGGVLGRIEGDWCNVFHFHLSDAVSSRLVVNCDAKDTHAALIFLAQSLLAFLMALPASEAVLAIADTTPLFPSSSSSSPALWRLARGEWRLGLDQLPCAVGERDKRRCSRSCSGVSTMVA